MKAFALSLATLSLFAVSGAQAQDSLSGHQQRLAEIQKRISLNFEVDVNFPQQVQVVNQLYNSTVVAKSSAFYGPGALVQSIVVRNLDSTDDAKELASLAKLRGHTLYYTPDGKSADLFRTNARKEADTLGQIQDAEAALAKILPGVRIERQGDVISQVVGTNESYLSALQSLNYAFSSAEFLGGAENLKEIIIVNSEDPMSAPHFERGTYWNNPNSVVLWITVSDHGIPAAHVTNPGDGSVPQPGPGTGSGPGTTAPNDGGGFEINSTKIPLSATSVTVNLKPKFYLQALNILLGYGFQKVGSDLMDNQDLPQALQALTKKLNPQVAEKLKAQRIHGFVFNAHWNEHSSLLDQSDLLVAEKPADISQEIDFLTGN